MSEFSEYIDDMELIVPQWKGATTHGLGEYRIDRFLVTKDWDDMFRAIEILPELFQITLH